MIDLGFGWFGFVLGAFVMAFALDFKISRLTRERDALRDELSHLFRVQSVSDDHSTITIGPASHIRPGDIVRRS